MHAFYICRWSYFHKESFARLRANVVYKNEEAALISDKIETNLSHLVEQHSLEIEKDIMSLAKIKELLLWGRAVVPEKYRSKSFVYVLLLCCMTLDNLNVTGALTTSVSIADQFNASSTTVSWVLSAYALTLGSFIIFFGKLADVIGVHTVFLLGVSTMALFSLITATIENSVIALIVFRALQGISAAALMPSGYALIANYFHGPALGKAIRGLAICMTSSFGIGTVLGGAFTSTNIGYKGFFYFTFAASTLCAIILYFTIIPIEKTEGHKKMKLKNLNFSGVAMIVIGLLLIIFGLTEGGFSWNSPKVYVTIPIGVILLVAAVLFENVYLKNYKKKHQDELSESKYVDSDAYKEILGKNNEENERSLNQYNSEGLPKPDWRLNVDLMFPKEMFKLTNFFPLLIGYFMAYFALIGIMSDLIQYHIYVDNDSSLIAALKVLPVSIGLVTGAVLYNEKLVKLVTVKWFILMTVTVQLGCSIWVSRTDYKIQNSFWIFEFVSQFLWGWGCNWFFMVYFNAIMGEAPLHLQGVVSGVFQTAGQVAVAIASAIVSSILGELVYKEGDPQYKEEQYKKFHNTLYVAIAGNAAFFISSFLVKNPKSESQTNNHLNDLRAEGHHVEDEIDSIHIQPTLT